MRKVLLLVALCAFVLPFGAHAEKAPLKGTGQYTIPEWFKDSFLDLREDAASAGKSGKRLLVFFGQEGCPYCATLINNNFSQMTIVTYTRQHFDSIEINLWGDREVTDFSGQALPEKEFAAKHKVWFTPTILFFDEHGKQVLRINGYYPPHQFLAALRYVAEKKEREVTFAQYLAKVSPPPVAGSLHAESFFVPPPHDLSRLAGKPIAVFFEQKDCPDCDALHNNTFRQPATLEQLRRFHVLQLDRWSDAPLVTPQGEETTARQWAERLGIAYVPSAVLFDAGKEVIRIEALLKAFHVQSVLDYAASGAYRSQPNLQRFIRERADHLREQGVTIDLWE
jgi:thioredoxin-related protein